jgi:streptomycin 6-kinase
MGLIPSAFAETTIAREGSVGAAWLEELPGIVAELLARWDCVVDGAACHGEVGLVLPVLSPAPAVLKVSFPHPGNVHEPDAFALWDGRGAVRMYQRADEQYAMLLERAEPRSLANEAGSVIAAAAGELSRRLTIPAPAGLARLSERVDEWRDELVSGAAEFPAALPASVVASALAVVDELGPDQPELVVHGDFHARNILRAEREPWLAVDPKGYVGDPAYDGATLLMPRAAALLETSDQLLKDLEDELEVFADAAELDPVRIRRWAHFRAAQGCFYGWRNGFGRARGGSYLDRLVALAGDIAIEWSD